MKPILSNAFSPTNSLSQIEVLSVIMPYVEYKESKAIYDEAKVHRDIRGHEYKEAEARNKPLKDFKEYVE